MKLFVEAQAETAEAEVAQEVRVVEEKVAQEEDLVGTQEDLAIVEVLEVEKVDQVEEAEYIGLGTEMTPDNQVQADEVVEIMEDQVALGIGAVEVQGQGKVLVVDLDLAVEVLEDN